MHGWNVCIPFRDRLSPGERSRLKLEDESPLLDWLGRGETSVVGGSENTSEGVSRSGVKMLLRDSSWGGRAGSDLSTFGRSGCEDFLVFLRRRAMSDSWQDMQKIP